MKNVYKIENDGNWITVAYQPYGPLETVLFIDCEIDWADCIGELVCAALNSLEAAKHANNSRVKRGAKRPHARKRMS